MYFALYSDTARFGKDGGFQTIGDVFKNGLPTALIGLLTVFAVLAIVWGVLELFHLISHGRKPKQTPPAQHSAIEPPPSLPLEKAPPVTPEVATPATSTADDEEIIAVIAAAIAAAESEQPTGSFRVVSFKRK